MKLRLKDLEPSMKLLEKKEKNSKLKLKKRLQLKLLKTLKMRKMLRRKRELPTKNSELKRKLPKPLPLRPPQKK